MHAIKHIAVALLCFLAATTSSFSADIWYEDNNLGEGREIPADFFSKFSQQESFKQATGYIDVYMLRVYFISNMSDEFISKTLNPYLKNNKIKLAIDAGGATWSKAQGREKIVSGEFDQLQRLKRLGVEVDYISLQSVLSKPLKTKSGVVEYTLSERIDDIINYAKAVRAIYPHAEIGIIDALPSQGREYRSPYRMLKDCLVKEGLKLSYIHLDIPFEIVKEQKFGITWKKLREIESYVEDDLGLTFGYFSTSRLGGYTSSRAFHDYVIASLKCYSGAGGTPDDFIISSWFPYPKKTIPETATGDDYPAMRTVLEFGKQLAEQEETRGKPGKTHLEHPDYLGACGVSNKKERH